ncbi:MAG: TIGR02281 family clan AA aspartic protease [Phormidesmis sp.]
MDWFRFSNRLILLPSLAGLAGYACTTAMDTTVDTTASVLEPVQSSKHSAPAPTTANQPIDGIGSPPETGLMPAAADAFSPTVYQEGLDLAASAERLSQSAISPDDWGLVESRWKRAADTLKTVSVDDRAYDLAQRKASEYAANAEATADKIARLQTPIYVPLPDRSIVEAAPQPASLPLTSTSTPSVGQRVQVPIVRRLHGTPVVKVRFNNVKTYEMILDTGASRTLITRQMADELNVVPTERMIAATASQSEVSFDIGRVSTVSVGEVVLENARVSIGDAVSIGLLGNDFLRDYDVTIRSQAGIVELVRAY